MRFLDWGLSYVRGRLCLSLSLFRRAQRRKVRRADIVPTVKLRIARTVIVGSHGVTRKLTRPINSRDRASVTQRRKAILTNLTTRSMPRLDL